MPELEVKLATVLADRFAANAARVRELAARLSDAQFWTKPFPFGNSFGHLVLHLTGNLNYYIGAQIAQTGYVRDRPREFSDANPPAKEETLQRFEAAVAMVRETIHDQSSVDWTKPYAATGSTAADRLSIFLVCESHIQLHIGQMLYLGYQWQQTEK